MSRRVIRSKAQARSPLYVLFAVMAVVLVCIVLSIAVLPAFAGASSTREKRYSDYEIRQGDSLWSIAAEYSCPEYSDSERFIREVMQINHLTDPDSIHAGSFLVIPYYVDVK
ncbi:MAG: LysM peptidoglycan-binding domain-containing protein [Lachnospiraceae bacterium]|nr:LysM peptidoglycan-binding domain-containing protein [Lachnospiraceae bacterium]